MNKLKIEFTIFAILVITAFSVIIIQEKMTPMLNKKVDEKMFNYLQENYAKDLDVNGLGVSKTKYKNHSYQKTIYNPTNDKLNFTIIYKNKEFSDNYQENYVEGKEFLNYISNKTNQIIHNYYKEKTKVTIDKKLNEYNDKIKEKLLKEDNLIALSIYNLDIELTSNLSETDITKLLIDTNTTLESSGIIPRTYSFTIIDTKDVAKYITIKNIKPDLIKSNSINTVIKNIFNNKKDDIIINNNIEYEINN